MANIHDVRIVGIAPYNLGRDEPAVGDALLKIVGEMNTPCTGFSLAWKKERYIGNEHGGQTSMYGFEITGQEAVRIAYLEHIIKTVVSCRGGDVVLAEARDIENRFPWDDVVDNLAEFIMKARQEVFPQCIRYGSVPFNALEVLDIVRVDGVHYRVTGMAISNPKFPGQVGVELNGDMKFYPPDQQWEVVSMDWTRKDWKDELHREREYEAGRK